MSSTSKAAAQKVIGSFGRLWGRGHESFGPDLRRIFSIQGKGATTYLQGLVTSDLTTPPVPPKPEPHEEKDKRTSLRYVRPEQKRKLQDYGMVEFTDQLRATCFLDNKGRIVTDSLLWKQSDEHYYIDCPGSAADELLTHLKQYKLRRTKVQIADCTDSVASHVVFGTLNTQGTPPGLLASMDPRHPSLGMRVLQLPPPPPPPVAESSSADNNEAENRSDDSSTSSSSSTLQERKEQFSRIMAKAFPLATGNYEMVRKLAGIAEGSELSGKIALETNQEFLNAVSFDKGCYLGQELTARVQHTGAIRKRLLPLLLMDTRTQIPSAWVHAGDLQKGRHLGRFRKRFLKALPTRLPRISIAAAGQLVAILTGSIPDPFNNEDNNMPSDKADEDSVNALVKEVQEKAEHLLAEIQEYAVSGAKIVDVKSGKTIGRIVSPAVPGTNAVVAMMRLDSVGLTGDCRAEDGFWSKLNKVKIGKSENEFRYLPYLPLWWPDLDPETGKARDENAEDEEEESDDDDDDDEEDDKENKLRMPRVRFEIDTIPLVGHGDEKKAQQENKSPSSSSSSSDATVVDSKDTPSSSRSSSSSSSS